MYGWKRIYWDLGSTDIKKEKVYLFFTYARVESPVQQRGGSAVERRADQGSVHQVASVKMIEHRVEKIERYAVHHSAGSSVSAIVRQIGSPDGRPILCRAMPG